MKTVIGCMNPPPTRGTDKTPAGFHHVGHLQSLLRPSSALSACEFATCMQAIIPSPVPACLPLLPRPSLALSPSEFESLYMRALTPTRVPAGFRQSGSRPGQPAWPITGLTTRVFRRPLRACCGNPACNKKIPMTLCSCSTLHIFRITCLLLSLTILL